MIRQRVISALFIAALLIGAVLGLPAFWSALALSVVMLAASWEWSGFVGSRRRWVRAAFVAMSIGLCVCWWLITNTPAALRLVLWFALSFWCLALLWVFWMPQRVNSASVGAAGLLALSLAWLALVRMRMDLQDGDRAVLYALLIVWLADSGAYFAGRAWGVRKLAPAVSPGKTWAGMCGGLAACAVLAALTAWIAGIPVTSLLLVTLIAGAFSVVGDLTESLCKRFAGLKDSGSLIPGHGGVLDRFDSLLAAAPLLLLGIELLPGLRA
ncbi:MAG: phosphatidate cytidylyltransferase [Steroidobacteraceae bacterium]